ncbi:MAG TPA: hypothetical protein VE957_05540 [Terriglobales bacterium]|nr:hypothetical protein [Terriglobales bacterium]
MAACPTSADLPVMLCLTCACAQPPNPSQFARSRIVRGPVRHAQTYLNKVLREHDLGRQVEGAESLSTNISIGGLRQPRNRACGKKATAATKACCADMSGQRSAPEI